MPPRCRCWSVSTLVRQGYAVARVNKVIDFEPATEAARRQNLNQYNQWWTGAESLAYFNELKRRFKAEILAAKPLPGCRQRLAQLGSVRRTRYNRTLSVAVAQLVESQIVILVVVGSSPISHPI